MSEASVGVPHRPADQVSVRVARVILDAISQGEFPVGSRLPSERMLADRFEVSRPSLREALSALQFAGAIESRQGFGTIVVSHERTVVGGEEDARYSRVDLIEARMIFEPEAVRLAATNPETEAIAHARTLVDGMWVAVEAAADLGVETDLNVHMALVQICRNPIVRSAAVNVLQRARTNHWMTARSAAWTDPRTIEAWTIQHESTLSAILSGEGERAARASRHHLLNVVELVTARGRLSAADRGRLEVLLKAFNRSAAAPARTTLVRRSGR